MTITPPRQRILTGLATVIARDGYTGSKIDAIVSEAHVSFRTFYEEFPNKEACFLELHASLFEMMIRLIRGAVVFDRPWKQVIRQAFAVYFEALTAQPRLTHAVLVELATLSEEARQSRERAMTQFTEMLCELVEQGRAANPDIPSTPLPPLTARAILGGVAELVTSRATQHRLDDLSDLIDTTTDLLWTAVTGQLPSPTVSRTA